MPKPKKDQEVSKKEKYLVQGLFKDCNPKTWYLFFRVPQRFGGKLIRQSLFTEDLVLARQIRDKFITPILAENAAIAALEVIGKSILQSQGEAVAHLTQLKNIITSTEGIKLSEAVEKYKEWMVKTSGLRHATIQKYSEALNNAIAMIGDDKIVGILSKGDAAKLRDMLVEKKKSPTTIDNIFSTFRGFLRWLIKEGHIGSPYVVDNFMIDLPPVRKENTAIVPPSLADVAMNVFPEWSLFTRILRYTGMRIGEVEACIAGHLDCGIIAVEGFRCFRISKNFSKTHADRFVPICDKLAPHLTPKAISKARKMCAAFDLDGRRSEGAAQKKYNRVVKKIEGLEKVSCHSWRVYAQTMMIEAGVDDLIVRRIIGHKDQSNVHYGYTAGRIEAMKKALDVIP